MSPPSLPVTLVALGLLAECTPAMRPLAEIAVPPPAATASPPIATAAPAPAAPPSGQCERRLRVASIAGDTPTCEVHGLAVGATATLSLPCAAAGDAAADFGGGQVFRGTTDGVQVVLRSVTTVQLQDGCTWQFTQQIAGAPAERRLVLEYEEEIVDGDECFGPCGAGGAITVE